MGLFFGAFCLLVWRCASLDVVRSTGRWSRIVAIGDVHGDPEALRACLGGAGVLTVDDEWCAEDGTLVLQCGDVVGRGSREVECLELLAHLKELAPEGSDVAMLMGNHEFFADGLSPLVADLCGETPVFRQEGDSVFVHAALLHADDRANVAARDRLRNAAAGFENRRDRDGFGQNRQESMDGTTFDLITDLVHDRAYAWGERRRCDPRVRGKLQQSAAAVAALGCARVVVGHNVVADGIDSFTLPSPLSPPQNPRHDSKAPATTVVYRIDTGMSRAVLDGRKECLELTTGTQPRVVSHDGKRHPVTSAEARALLRDVMM
mmetsp:Transcript_29660/g.95635  ORF Transcript_29660/g.95635 Transcript_29660/m.95635 type:complete len:320 (+) Transcript_29660:270-1229(+)